jgi:hypothetical protein
MDGNFFILHFYEMKNSIVVLFCLREGLWVSDGDGRRGIYDVLMEEVGGI